MLQTSKRPIAMLMALIMCLALLSGIVLPEVAETAMAVSDPYARINATSVGANVYAPGANVYFVNTAWASSAPADEGETFTVTYGDGTTWGNGVTYQLTYGTNALSSWTLVTRTLRHLDPASNNNPVFVFFPGQQYSTANADPDEGIASDGSNKSLTMITPADTSTATEADYMNAYFIGPQAGKSPVTAKGNIAVANGRTVDATKEFVFKSTFWGLKNGIINADGFAADAAFKLFSENTTTAASAYVTGFHLDNWYVDLNTTGGAAFLAMGGNNKTNLILSVATITNSYFVQSERDANTQAPVMQNNYTLIDNCVFKDFRYATTDAYKQNQHIKLGPSAYSAANGAAFLGDYAGKYSGNVTNCTFYDWTSNHILRMNYNNYTDYGANAAFTFDSNIIAFSGNEEVTGGGDFIYLDKVESSTTCGALLNITNNDVSLSKVDSDQNYVEKFVNGGAGFNIAMTIRENVIRADYTKVDGSGMMVVEPFYSFSGLTDLSGNLSVDYQGNVHTARSSYMITNRSGYFHVMTDIYASDEMAGGVAEMFTVQETTGDLLVTNSRVMVQTYGNEISEMETDGIIKGTVVVLPEAGKAYSTANLFVYNNSKVEFLGVYSNEACTTPVTTLSKGFGTLYAKARYATANTTCTVRYTITEPDTFFVVDPSGLGTYTFNGDTYTSGAINGTSANVTFYATLSAARDAHTTSPVFGSNQPMSKVFLLMPGSYAGFGGSRSIALIGPKFGVDPRSIDSFDIQNSRSYDDNTKEAIFTSQPQFCYYNVSPDSHFYITFAGVSAKTTRGLRINNNTKSGSGTTYDTRMLAFINAQDFLNRGTGSGNFFYSDYTQAKDNSCEIYLYVNRCYADCDGAQGTSGSPAYCFSDTTYASFKVNNFTAGHLGTRVCYSRPMNQKYVARRLEGAYLTVKNSNFQTPAVGSTYIIGMVGSSNQDLSVCDNSAYTEGVTVNIIGNKFSNNTQDGLKLHADLDDVFNLNVINNTFDRGSEGTGASIFVTSYYRVDKHDGRGEGHYAIKSTRLRSATLTGNTFIGKAESSRYFKLDEDGDYGVNNFDATDNFYFQRSGSTLVADDPNSTGVSIPYVYTDTNKTYTDADFELAAGGFSSVEKTNNRFFRWTANGNGNKNASDIAFKNSGVTLVGVYSDFDCTTPVTNIAKGSTVYVKATKGAVTTVQRLLYTSPWGELGLAPATDGAVVVVPTNNTVMFVTPTSDRFASVLCTSTGAATSTAPSSGDTFYIKMPTTGFIYQLVYGTNAATIQEANLRQYPTVVFCPGNYNTGTNYNGSGTGNYAVGLPNNGNNGKFHDWKFVGPYLGVAASEGESDALINGRSLSGTYEARISTSFIYIMNDIISDGGSFTIDGMNLSNSVYVSTAAGTNASNMYNKNNNFSINFRNMVVGNLNETDNFLKLFSNGGGYGNSATTKNLTKSIMTFNVDNCHFTWGSSTVTKGGLNADFINIRHTAWLDTTQQNVDSTGLYINPTNAANYENPSHKPTYLAEDNYISIACGTLFTIATGGSSDITSANRAGIDIIFRNNKMVNTGISRDNGIRSAVATTYTMDADQRGIYSWIFTGNTVTNTTGEDPAYGAILCSQTTGDAKVVDISNNTFTGYPRPFTGLSNGTYENNLYFALDGVTPYVPQPRHGEALSDVALGDYNHWASDFNVTAVAGDTSAASAVTWAVNANCAPTGSALVSKMDNPTASNPKLSFKSSKVVVKGVYTDAECQTAASGDLASGNTYYVKAGYNDSNTTYAVITLMVEQDFGDTPVYSGNKYYLSQTVSGLPDGKKVVLELLEGSTKTAYVFTVGENVFATPNAVPYVSAADHTRNIYLLPQEYDAAIACGTADDRGELYNIYGAKAGINPVTLSSGIPTATRKSTRTNDEQESIISYGISLGYQACVNVDGVAFGGTKDDNSGIRINETSTAATGIEYVTYRVTNCITVNAGGYGTGTSYAIMSAKNTIAKDITMTDNHFILENSSGHEMLIARCAKSIEAARNYVNEDATSYANWIWLSTTNSSNASFAYSTFDVNVHHNNVNNRVYFDNMSHVDSASLTFANNRFRYTATSSWLAPVQVAFPEAAWENTNFENITVAFNNNIVAPSDTAVHNYYGLRINATDGSELGSITVSGNTFDNTSGAFAAAILNFSPTPITITGNTFTNFKYNYTSRNSATYYDGACVAFNYAEVDVDEQNVFIASNNTFNSKAANYFNNADTLGAHMASGDAGVDEATHTARDITDADIYLFNPVGNMMVKATMPDGTVYYNAVPVDTEDTFTAQLCSVDGSVVGTAYTVTVTKDVLSVSATPATSVIQDMTGEAGFNSAKPYAAYFVGNIATTSEYSDIVVGAVDLKVLDYGMYYANISTAFDDLTAYVNNALVINDKTVGIKKSYASNANGLDSVYQNYSFRFKFIAPDAYRYGKMYVTYRIGDAVRTVFSDTITLHAPAAE